MAYEAKIIADSICNGKRLTTMQLTHPRIVHSEFMTHAAFARNASSSRAIPFSKVLQKILEDPFIPEKFGVNEKGMQASINLYGMDHDNAVTYWLSARDRAIEIAQKMFDPNGLNVHKQIVNRLLEPWSWITVCCTGDADAWSNYFALRCHKDAQPDIQTQAYMAQYAYFTSCPIELAPGEWHTPYVSGEEKLEISNHYMDPLAVVKISTGRICRTSYLTQEGIRDFSEDIKLHDRLTKSIPMHSSPLEQTCLAMNNSERYAKYTGWKSYRHFITNEYITNFIPNHSKLVDPPW